MGEFQHTSRVSLCGQKALRKYRAQPSSCLDAGLEMPAAGRRTEGSQGMRCGGAAMRIFKNLWPKPPQGNRRSPALHRFGRFLACRSVPLGVQQPVASAGHGCRPALGIKLLRQLACEIGALQLPRRPSDHGQLRTHPCTECTRFLPSTLLGLGQTDEVQITFGFLAECAELC